MQSVCGCFYSHLTSCDVGIASVKLIVLMRLHVACEKHFCFMKQLLHVLSLSCVARYRIIYMKMQVRFLLLMLYYL